MLDLQTGGVIGRYRILSRLGAGAMGVVWCAFDPQLDRKVAIKVVHGSFARNAEASSRLLREARAMAKLSHRAVVTVHDAGDVEGRLFLAMELVQGTTLGQMLRARSDDDLRDWRKWLAMMLEAGRGLEAAHGAGVLHRDFKPDNVLVDDNGRVCVADFGLATLGESERVTPISERMSKARFADLTTTGALLGTPAYMSPQQLRGEPIDTSADQFNFCVATYEALYGRRPFATSGEGIAMIDELERAIEDGAIVPPPDGSLVPDDVFAVVRRGLAPKPSDRWPSMTALLGELERALKPVKRPPTAARSAQLPRSRTIAIAAIAGALVASIGVVAVLLLAKDGTPQRQAKRLFDIPLKTEIAISPDGRRVALGNHRLEVRELDTGKAWAAPLLTKSDIRSVVIDEHVVRFGMRNREPGVWRYASDGAVDPLELRLRETWYGESVAGDVYYDFDPGNDIVVVANGVEVKRWSASTTVEMIEISPDRKRIASLEGSRFHGRIVIRDVTRDVVITSRDLSNPTAIAWENERSLVYATGTTEEPRIFRVRVGDTQLGEPEVIYGREYGWFGEIAIANRRMLFVEMSPRTRARLVANDLTRELDTVNVAVALGWLPDGKLLTWNRSAKRVEKTTVDDSFSFEPTEIELVAEPANATLSGDILLSAIRREAGRELVAHSLTTGKRLWSHEPAQTLAVRCAGDLKPPCFVIRAASAEIDQVQAIDPATGVVGDAVLAKGIIEDIAVNEAGDRILVAMRDGDVLEIDPAGNVLAQHARLLPAVRSIAYLATGGYVIAGTRIRNTFVVARVVDGKLDLVSQAENDLLSLVRPTRDGSQFLILSRVYAPALWELPL